MGGRQKKNSHHQIEHLEKNVNTFKQQLTLETFQKQAEWIGMNWND